VSEEKAVEIRSGVDVRYRRHSVVIGLPSGEVLEKFEIAHRPEGFAEFFTRIGAEQGQILTSYFFLRSPGSTFWIFGS
jgi:hypothetical protein